MSTYTLEYGQIIRDDGAMIPRDPANADYQAYLKQRLDVVPMQAAPAAPVQPVQATPALSGMATAAQRLRAAADALEAAEAAVARVMGT